MKLHSSQGSPEIAGASSTAECLSLREGIPSLRMTTLMDEVSFIAKAATGVSALHEPRRLKARFSGRSGGTAEAVP